MENKLQVALLIAVSIRERRICEGVVYGVSSAVPAPFLLQNTSLPYKSFRK
jgi:hypothetical protein